MADTLLSIRNLCVDYITDRGPVRAVDSVSLELKAGEILGLAGESGSGKSTLAQTLLRILPPPAVISGGEIHFQGEDVLAMDEAALQGLRWNRISMVFQSAMDSLNPVVQVGDQLVDTLTAHGTGTQAARKRAADLFKMVSIDPARLSSYPHQLSGGMRQRVCIALALALEPSLVILDEPTTALDVVVELEILTEIRELQRRMGFAVIFITHDLARMLQFSDRVAVFYAGRLAEIGQTQKMLTTPGHPYTAGLLRAFPPLRDDGSISRSIPGSPPSLRTPPSGCRFHPRCEFVMDICAKEQPQPVALAADHISICHAAAPSARF